MSLNRISPEYGRADVVHNKTLLFVDDEPNVLSSLRRLFRRENFRVVTANSGAEALEILQSVSIPVIISDERMPDMPGTKFLERVKQQYPEIVTCILSGYADNSNIMSSMNRGDVFRFLPKPWSDEELKLVIQQCFALHALMSENKHLSNKITAQNETLCTLTDNLDLVLNEKVKGYSIAHAILDQYPHSIVALTSQGYVGYLNRESRLLLRRAEDSIEGKHYTDVFPLELVEFIDHCMSNPYSDRLVLPMFGQCYDVLALRLTQNDSFAGLCIQLEQVYNPIH